MLSIRRLALAAAALAFSAPAFAQDTTSAATPDPAAPVEQATGGDSFTIGAGVATVPYYEGADTNRIIPAAAARGSISGFNFSTRGTRLYVDLVPTGPGPVVDFQLGPIAGVNLNRTGRNLDDARVEALGKLDTAIELGGFVGVGKTGVLTSDYDKLTLSVSYIHDVNHVYRSYVITPQIDYGTPLSRKIYIGLSANATYAGDGYADAYFGISPLGAARSGLRAYNPDKGWKSASVSALANLSLTGDLLHGLSLVGGVSYTRLKNDFARSPIVTVSGSANQFFAALGLAYTF